VGYFCIFQEKLTIVKYRPIGKNSTKSRHPGINSGNWTRFQRKFHVPGPSASEQDPGDDAIV
jgi:hypothetical protein